MGNNVRIRVPGLGDRCPRVQDLVLRRDQIADEYRNRYFFGKSALQEESRLVEAEITSLRAECKVDCPGPQCRDGLGRTTMQPVCGMEFLNNAAVDLLNEIELFTQNNQIGEE